MLVNVGDAQFWLPEERVVCSFGNLVLLRDGRDYRCERWAARRVAAHLIWFPSTYRMPWRMCPKLLSRQGHKNHAWKVPAGLTVFD